MTLAICHLFNYFKLALQTVRLHVIQDCHEDNLYRRSGSVLPGSPAKLHSVVQSVASITTTLA